MKMIEETVWKVSEEDITAAKLSVDRAFQKRCNKDSDCSEIPQFVPIKLELRELLKYWYTEGIKHDLDSCIFSMSTREHFVGWLSDKRRNQISDLLSVQEIECAIAEAQESLKKSNYWFTSEKDWDILFHGTEEERKELIGRFQDAFLSGE